MEVARLGRLELPTHGLEARQFLRVFRQLQDRKYARGYESPSMNRVGQVGRSPSSSPSRGQGIQALRTRRTCFARTPLMSDW